MPDYPAFDFDQVDFITSDTHYSHARIIELASRSRVQRKWMPS